MSSPPRSQAKDTQPTRLVLGLGNDLLTDDAIGLRVAAELRARLRHQPDITISQTTEMGLALLDQAVGFDDLVLIDAVQTRQAPPGAIHEIDPSNLALATTISPHFVGIGETLALGRMLGLAVPRRVQIFAIEVQNPFTIGTRMTSTLEAALGVIVDQLVRKLGSALPGSRRGVSCGERIDHEPAHL